MMLTFRAGKVAMLALTLAVVSACSREQQDWRSAEATDTIQGYGQFLERHPESELATEARTRVAQLTEDHEWQLAGSADTVDGYKQFLAQHPNGKWAQEARIRMENFALGMPPVAGAGVSAAVPPALLPSGSAVASPGESAQARAAPGELAQAPGSKGAQLGKAWTSEAPAAGELAPATRVAPGEPAQAAAAPAQLAQAPVPTRPLPTQASPTQGAPAQAPLAQGTAASGFAASGSATPTSPTIATAWRSTDSASAGYGVQLGAFASETAATNQWQQLVARFNTELRGLAPHVVAADTATGRLFRLQAQVVDEARARALCEVLKKQAQACVPVLPH